MPTSYDSSAGTKPNLMNSPALPDEIESIAYYTLSGIRIPGPGGELYIRVARYRDGRTGREVVRGKTETR